MNMNIRIMNINLRKVRCFVGNVNEKLIVNPITTLFHVVIDSYLNRITYDQKAIKLLQLDIKILKDTTRSQQYRIAQLAHSLLSKLEKKEKNILIEAIAVVPFRDRENVLRHAKPLLEGILDVDEKVYIIKAIAAIPSGDRENVLQHAKPLLEGISNGYEKADIIEAIAKISSEDRKNVLERAMPFLEGVLSKRIIISTIAAIPSDDWESFQQQVTPLLEGVELDEKVYIIKAIAAIPSDDRKNVSQHAMPLIRDVLDLDEKVNIIKAIAAVPSDERENVFQHAKPILEGVEEGYVKVNIIEAITKVPLGDRENVLRNAMPFLEGVLDGYEKRVILECIVEIPSGDREGVLRHAMPFLEGVLDGSIKASIIQAIAKIPSGDREGFLRHAMPFLEGVLDGSIKASIIQAIAKIPSEDRADIMDKFQLYNREKIIFPQAMPDFFYLMSTLQKEDREGVCEKIPANLFSHLSQIGQSNILNALEFFPVSQLDKIIDVIQASSNDEDESNFITAALQANPEFREVTYLYLQTKLSEESHKKEIQEMARYIFNNQSAFLLHDAHPLYQAVLEVVIMLDGDRNDLRDPLMVYDRLRKMSKEPLPPVRLPTIEIDGKEFAVNLDRLRSRSQFSVTKAQLPEGIDHTSLSALFSAFENRLSHLDAQAQLATKAEILNITESGFEALKQNFQDPYLLSLLRSFETLNKEALVLKAAACLCALIQSIRSLSDELKGVNLLTPREESLFLLSESIQHCPKGKAGGIILAYNQLDPKYQYNKAQAETSNRIKVNLFVEKLVEAKMLNLFSTESPLMRELTGVPAGPIGQLVHQSLYLENSIGVRIGFKDQVEFDKYTRTLYNSLVGKDLTQLMQTFFNHFSAESLADELYRHRFPDEEATMIVAINEVLETYPDLKGFWDSEGYGPACVSFFDNKDASKKLLIETGFLQEIVVPEALEMKDSSGHEEKRDE